MSARAGVKTLPDFLADIDERLRRVERETASRPALPDHGDLPGLEDDDHPYVKEAEFTIAGQILVGIGDGQLIALDVPPDSPGAVLAVDESAPWRVAWHATTLHSHEGTGAFATILGPEGSNGPTASGDRSLSAGVDAEAAGEDAVSYGYASTSPGARSASYGPLSQSPGDESFAAAYLSLASGEAAVSVGVRTTASHDRTVVLGSDSLSTIEDQVAIGARHLELGEISVPGVAPDSSFARLLLDDTDGVLKVQKDSGALVSLESTGSAHVLKEDGTSLTQRAGLNFVNGLVATDDAGNNETDVNVSYGSPVGLANANADGAATTVARSNHEHKRDVRVAKAGSDVGTRNRLNFIEGSGVTLTVADDSGSDEVDITIAASVAGIAEGRPEAGGTVYLVKPGVELFDTGTGTLTQNESRYEPFLVSTAIDIDQLVIEVTTNVASSNIRLGIYEADEDWQPGALVAEGAVSAATTGVKTLSVTETLTPGRYVAAINTDSVGVAYRRWQGGSRYAGFLTTLGASPFIGKMSVLTSYGAFPDPGTAWNIAAGTAGPMFHGVLLRVSNP